MRRLNGGDHEQVCVQIGKADMIPRMMDQLRQKSALRSAVPFPKWVKNVGIAIKIRDFIYEFIMRQTSKAAVIPEPLEELPSLAFDVLFLLMSIVRTLPAHSYKSEKRKR